MCSRDVKTQRYTRQQYIKYEQVYWYQVWRKDHAECLHGI